jgi:hypothetical protein
LTKMRNCRVVFAGSGVLLDCVWMWFHARKKGCT